MSYRLRWTKRALRRLDQIGAEIYEGNPAAAARIVARIGLAVDGLLEFPAMGRPGRIANTRELVFADIPYIVPYRVAGHEIQILTIMHAMRKWPDEL